MNRKDMIDEMTSLTGPNAWAKPMQWDAMTDRDIETLLTNSRAYAANVRSGRVDAANPRSGFARMDAADTAPAYLPYASPTRIDDRDELRIKQREMARLQLGQPSAASSRADAAPNPVRLDAESTDEDDAKSRLRAHSRAQAGVPSRSRK